MNEQLIGPTIAVILVLVLVYVGRLAIKGAKQRRHQRQQQMDPNLRNDRNSNERTP